MTWLYLHLITNHFPIILTVVGTVACIIGAARRNHSIWTYGVITLALGGVAAIPTWITGYQAHYVVEYRLGLPEGLVEPHELLAEGLMWFMIPMSGIATFAWWRAREEPRRGPSPTWIRPALLVSALAGCVMLGFTAFQGSRISHGAKQRAAPADSAAPAPQSVEPIADSLPAGTGRTAPK
jgi:hypothetical protein